MFKHFPLAFHRAARPTAIASVAAQDQGKFWEYHDVLFKKTGARELKPDQAELVKYAEEAGLDVERFKADLEGKKAEYDKKVSADYAEGQRVEVRGTPTLYLNGKKVRNRSAAAMAKVVDELLKGEG